MNALAALASVNAVGVDPASVLSSLSDFRSVKRRLEVIGEAAGVTVYDDFAHHPRPSPPRSRDCARRSAGAHRRGGGAAQQFDAPGCARRCAGALAGRRGCRRVPASAELAWDAGHVVGALRGEGVTAPDADALIEALRARVRAGDHVVFMSNGGFDGAPRRFFATLQGR
jgi:UDP-N-acetylmuramate: L-alanyl-gamma-D-glutamyl-meso-diaminopimelate ligase